MLGFLEDSRSPLLQDLDLESIEICQALPHFLCFKPLGPCCFGPHSVHSGLVVCLHKGSSLSAMRDFYFNSREVKILYKHRLSFDFVCWIVNKNPIYVDDINNDDKFTSLYSIGHKGNSP